MKLLRRWVLGGGVAVLVGLAIRASADATNAAPDFKEVYDLIKANLAGVTDDDLNRAEVMGLMEQLHGRVALVAGQNDTSASPKTSATVSGSVYDGGIAALRIEAVTDGLADKITMARKSLAATNTNALKGLILDLRYADGGDYPAAANAADLFIATERPLLDWGEGVVKSKANDNAVNLPLVVLVNKQTSDAAEALAAVLREDAHAILLGSTTAGETLVGRNFPLKNGQYLRIATATVKLGNGDALTSAGVKPDIQVTVKPQDEKAYYADPFKDLAASTAAARGTNNPAPVHRLSESDLIRERKERPGMDLEYLPQPADESDNSAGAAKAASLKTVVHDPVLARALDLVKGISAFRPNRTP